MRLAAMIGEERGGIGWDRIEEAEVAEQGRSSESSLRFMQSTQSIAGRQPTQARHVKPHLCVFSFSFSLVSGSECGDVYFPLCVCGFGCCLVCWMGNLSSLLTRPRNPDSTTNPQEEQEGEGRRTKRTRQAQHDYTDNDVGVVGLLFVVSLLMLSLFRSVLPGLRCCERAHQLT